MTVLKDPTPVAIAGEVLSAAEKATPRPWVVRANGVDESDFEAVFYVVHDHELGSRAINFVSRIGGGHGAGMRRFDADFIVTTCNAAEALSRAVIEGEKRERVARERIGELEARIHAALIRERETKGGR